MEISLVQNILTITTEKKQVLLGQDDTLTIDGLTIDMPGEYEKSGILLQTRRIDGILIHELQVERKIVGYIPASVTEASEWIIAFFDNLDILLVSGSKNDNKILEALESRVVIPYGESRDSFLQSVGQSELEAIEKYKSKEADFGGETTIFVRLA